MVKVKPMGTYEIRYSDLRKPGFKITGLRTDECHTIILRRNWVEFVEFEDAFFRTASSVMLPNGIPPSDSGTCDEQSNQDGIALVAMCLRHCEQFPDKKILVAGHTDTSGADSYNIPLSHHRASCVHAALAGEREEFITAASGPHLTNKEKLYPDEMQIVDWAADTFGWPCSMKQNITLWKATLAFQKSYNENGQAGNLNVPPLDLTGKFDRPTWGAIFDCYEAKLADLLGVTLADLPILRQHLTFLDAQKPVVGCGEYHPIDQVGRDNYHSQKNRRVEVQFFDPGEEPQLSCLKGECEATECELYDPRAYKRRRLGETTLTELWDAHWDRPGEPARNDEERKLILSAPQLPDGEKVLFEITQEAQGIITVINPPLESMAQGGRAEAVFNQWFHRDRIAYQVALKEGEGDDRFPPVSFSFVATAAGRQVAADPLLFSALLETSLVLITSSGEEPLANIPYTLLSPWGTRVGQSGTQGEIVIPNLPPGGLSIMIDDKVYAYDNTK